MSTILEALRRAERERQRGSIPSVHDPAPVLAGALTASPRGQALRRFRVPLLAALVLALAAALWWWRLPHELAAPAAAPATPLTAPLAAPVAPAASPPSAKAPERPATAKVRTAPPSAPAPAVRDAPPAPATAAQTLASKPATPPAPRSTTAPAPAKAPAEGPIFAPADLPAALRAELPRLHLAGITWSANARLRMAIVNGQVLHEGESAAPGLVLERIEPARTVWAFRGYRVALASQ